MHVLVFSLRFALLGETARAGDRPPLRLRAIGSWRVGLRTHVRPAGLTVTSPEGRRAVSGEYPSEGEIEIAVRPEEAGKVWRLRIEPGYQASLWLAGDAFPCLSVSRKQVLAPVAQ